MNVAPMIEFTLKETEEISWHDHISTYIFSVYGDDGSQYVDAAVEFNKMRQNVAKIKASFSETKESYIKYYGQLELLSLHFPVNDAAFSIDYVWTDVITSKKIKMQDHSFEKNNVIFNLGVLLTKIAGEQNRKELEGLKTALHSYQAAAGCFAKLDEDYLDSPKLVDLNHNCLSLFKNITLAQAQECFLERAIMDSKRPAILSKLAYQTSTMYGTLFDNLKNSSNLKNSDTKNWISIFEWKCKYYCAFAQYYKAIACESDPALVGEGFMRCQIAEKLMKELSKIQVDDSSLNSLMRILEPLITNKKNTLKKDNEMIYHSDVPKEETLKLDGALMATEMKFKNFLAEYSSLVGKDLFEKFIPVHVHETSSLYSEEKAKIIRNASDQIEKANVELETGLGSLSFQEVIDQVTTRDYGPTAELVERQQKLSKEERSFPYNDMLLNLDQMAATANEVLTNASLMLERETIDYETYRKQYGEKWLQGPSFQITKDLRGDISNLKSSLDKAKASDELLKNKLNHIIGDIIILSSTEQEFKNAFPTANIMDSPYDESTINRVKDQKKELDNLKAERDKLLLEIKELAAKDDIDNLLLLNKSSESAVIQSELLKYNDKIEAISLNLSSHTEIIKDLIKGLETLKKSMEADSAKAKSIELNSNFTKSYQEWKVVRKNIQDGIQYYGSLFDSLNLVQKHAVSIFSNDSHIKADFCEKRRVERENILNRLDKEAKEGDQALLKSQLQQYQQQPRRVSNDIPAGYVAPSPMNYPQIPQNRLSVSNSEPPLANPSTTGVPVTSFGGPRLSQSYQPGQYPQNAYPVQPQAYNAAQPTHVHGYSGQPPIYSTTQQSNAPTQSQPQPYLNPQQTVAPSHSQPQAYPNPQQISSQNPGQAQTYSSPQQGSAQGYNPSQPAYSSPQQGSVQGYSPGQPHAYSSPQQGSQGYNPGQPAYSSPQQGSVQGYSSGQPQAYSSPQQGSAQGYNPGQGQAYSSPQQGSQGYNNNQLYGSYAPQNSLPSGSGPQTNAQTQPGNNIPQPFSQQQTYPQGIPQQQYVNNQQFHSNTGQPYAANPQGQYMYRPQGHQPIPVPQNQYQVPGNATQQPYGAANQPPAGYYGGHYQGQPNNQPQAFNPNYAPGTFPGNQTGQNPYQNYQYSNAMPPAGSGQPNNNPPAMPPRNLK